MKIIIGMVIMYYLDETVEVINTEKEKNINY